VSPERRVSQTDAPAGRLIKQETDPVFCSVVIPTVGRATLSRAVQSVLDQTFSQEDFEVIVVNDSGEALPAEAWQRSNQVRVIQTNRRERSVARNTGAAIAQGKYLCFLDDDDWLLPGALEQFWDLACRNGDAAWLYGGIRVTSEAGECLAEVNSGLHRNCFAQIVGGAWAPIQASLVRADRFYAVGGYDPAIIGTEDLDLCTRIALGGTFANTPATVACLLRGESWHTSTNYRRAPDDIRTSRDRVLSEPGAFRRLLESADSGFWHGRILRVYLSVVVSNLRHRRLFAAVSRAVCAVAWFAMSGKHVVTPGFWEGLKAHHAPDTLHFVMERLEREARRPASEG
jgi:glycosyltransferase involved in cell wall biosynthesis